MVQNVLSKVSEEATSASRCKAPGQVDYEADLKRRPNYHDGSPRKSWDELDDIARWSWEKGAHPLDKNPE